MPRYSKSASKVVKGAMHKRKRGTLKSGSGRKVKAAPIAPPLKDARARKCRRRIEQPVEAT
jgi:hypothetical protein